MARYAAACSSSSAAYFFSSAAGGGGHFLLARRRGLARRFLQRLVRADGIAVARFPLLQVLLLQRHHAALLGQFLGGGGFRRLQVLLELQIVPGDGLEFVLELAFEFFLDPQLGVGGFEVVGDNVQLELQLDGLVATGLLQVLVIRLFGR